MKLFRVQIEWETVILADNAQDAENRAGLVIRQGDDSPSFLVADEIKAIDDLPSGWDKDCRPWGKRDDYDRTIGQILEP